MKNIVIFLAGLVIVVFTWTILDSHQKDKVIGLATMLSDERKCFNFLKAKLKDPDTAYVVKSFISTKADEEAYKDNNDKNIGDYEAFINVFVKAKNSYGAYDDSIFRCPLVDGKFRELNARIDGKIIN